MFEDDSNSNNGKKPPAGAGKFNFFTVLAWAAIIAAMVGLFAMSNKFHPTGANEISQATFLEKFASNQIAGATIMLNQQTFPLTEVTGRLVVSPDSGGKSTNDTVAFVSHNFLLTQDLQNDLVRSHQVTIGQPNIVVQSLIVTLLPFVLLAALFWFFFIRQIKAAGKGALSFGKSKARMLAKERNKTTFKDVAGVEEAMEEVSELVQFLKDPKKISAPWRTHPQRGFDDRAAGNGKNTFGKSDCW